MDEPFGALDAQLRTRLQGVLLDLCRRLNKTVLFVTHDLDEAIALADRCVVFSKRPGTIVKTIEVDLPRVRDLAEVRFDERFLRQTKKLWSLFSDNNWIDDSGPPLLSADVSKKRVAGELQ